MTCLNVGRTSFVMAGQSIGLERARRSKGEWEMRIEQLDSGLVVASDEPATPQVQPEHPSLKVIRDALAALESDLGEFEQTTHGYWGRFDIESVASEMVKCHQQPSAFTISNLSQAIRGFVSGRK